MHRTAILSNGTLPLGDDAWHLGFRPGALVDVIRTSANTLILRISDEHPVEVPFRRLDGEPERPALRGARRAS